MQKGIIVHTVVEREDGKILITRRAAVNDVLPEYWDIPGGTLEDGEDPAQGAIREAKEEAGVGVSSPRLFFYTSNVDTQKNKQFITLVFRAQYNGEEIVLNPEEHDQFAWIEPKEITKYQAVEYLEPALKNLNP